MPLLQNNNWQADAAILAVSGIGLILLRGGAMSDRTRKMLAIALVGAIAAVAVDGLIKPRVMSKV